MFPGAKYLAGEQSKQVCDENSENVDAVLEKMTCTVGVAAVLEVAGTLEISWAFLLQSYCKRASPQHVLVR